GGQPALIRPEAETGLMLINVPAGRHDLTIHFGETPGRIFASALTGLTLLGLIGAGVAKRSIVNPKGRLRTNQWSMINRQLSMMDEPPSRRSPASPPSAERSAVPCSPALLVVMALLIAGALWLKPLLRPVFTIHSPPDQALPAQYQTRINFTGGIQLIGYDLDKTVVPAGGQMQIVLYWQTDAAPLKANLQPFVHLDRLDTLTTVADATNYTPGDATTETVLPTFHWDNARYVRDEHDLAVPPDTPPLAYAVRIGMLDPKREGRLLRLADGSGDTAQLAIINIAPSPGSAPQLSEPLEVSLKAGQTVIQLTGFEITSLSPQQLDFKLAWRVNQPPMTNYTVFAQLLDLENNLVAGFDRPPLDGAYPTSAWLSGQTIIDPRTIPLRGVPAGEYRLIVGMYEPITQQRLITTTGADFIELTKVKIGNP
ncbi:MAG: hypothetical protein HYR94_15045, partial [Chloroflexi bacterium]|nr:hypothetical protein [Chloroflexota bacterium]